MYKMKTIDYKNVIMVLNNGQNDKSGTSILHIYGPGYNERYPMGAIIKIRRMLHLHSITCLEHFLKI